MTNNVILLKNRTTPRDPYHEKFHAEDYNPVFVPLLKHSPFDKTETIRYLTSDSFLETPIFIITSQRAVEVFNECLSEIKDESIRSNIFNKVGYTVGPATFKILKESGFKDVRGGDNAGNGFVLSEIIIKEISNDQEIVFFTGEIRKDIIPRKLKENNFKLIEKVIYTTQPREDIIGNFKKIYELISSTNKSGESDNWIVFFSPQGTESIINYMKGIKSNFKIASIGPTTEEYLMNNSINPNIVSNKPDAGSLFNSISNYGGN